MGSKSPHLLKSFQILEDFEIALVELEYAIADFAQYRAENPDNLEPDLIAEIQNKVGKVSLFFNKKDFKLATNVMRH